MLAISESKPTRLKDHAVNSDDASGHRGDGPTYDKMADNFAAFLIRLAETTGIYPDICELHGVATDLYNMGAATHHDALCLLDAVAGTSPDSDVIPNLTKAMAASHLFAMTAAPSRFPSM